MSTEVRYRPKGAALKLFKARQAEVALAGAAGTGKSLACLFRVHLAALKHPGTRYLVVRKTAVSLTSTTLVTFEKKVAKEALANRTVTWFGGSMREPACYRYSNGSTIVVGGMDKPEKIMSAEYDLVFCDEATELTIDDWEAISTRLRHGVLPWQQQIAACNPVQPTHWIKQRGDEGKLHLMTSLHWDNPAYVNDDGSYTAAGAAYMAKLDSLTGVRRLRLRDGVWAAAEGLIYDSFNPAVHLVDAFKIPDDWERYWSIDFGFTHPFVLQCWAKDPDGRLFLYREIFKSQKLVEDHAKHILRLVTDKDGRWTEPRPYRIFCDHDAEGRATFEKHSGLHTTKADKRVLEGIQAVQSRLKEAGDGRPRLFFLRDATVQRDPVLNEARKPCSTVEELSGYVWDDRKEAPVKQEDDGMDCMRYAVTGLDFGRSPGYRSFRY